MKKNFQRTLVFPFLTLFITTLFTVSCSSDDAPETTPITFNSFEASKTEAYIEEVVTIEFEVTGNTNLEVTSSNPDVTITKAASTIYEITATKATSATIYVSASNSDKTERKSTKINFYEHGVKDFNTVEGIKVNTDKSTKVTALLGEPDYIADSSTNSSLETWAYASKGLSFYIVKSTKLVTQAVMFDYHYYADTNSGTKFTTYPYTIGNDWKLNDTNTTIDMIVDELGTPTKSSTVSGTTLNVAYEYTTENIVFRFYSDSEDDYTGKKIIYFSVY